MTISEALAWQALWVFIFGYVFGNVAFIIRPSAVTTGSPGYSKYRGKRKLYLLFLALAIICIVVAVLTWNATLWINYSIINA